MADANKTMIVGQGPEANTRYISCFVQDTLLKEWGDWQEHDGKKLPHSLMGRTLWIAGLEHDGLTMVKNQLVQITAEYLASEQAHIWIWSNGYGGVSGYRLKRETPLPFSQSVIDILDRARTKRDYVPPLLLGLDGVA